jgi:hypothetical protein
MELGASSGNTRSGGGGGGRELGGRFAEQLPGGTGGGIEGLRERGEGPIPPPSTGPDKGAGGTAIEGADDATSKAIRL